MTDIKAEENAKLKSEIESLRKENEQYVYDLDEANKTIRSLKEEIRQLKYRLADEQDSSHEDCRKEIKLLKDGLHTISLGDNETWLHYQESLKEIQSLKSRLEKYDRKELMDKINEIKIKYIDDPETSHVRIDELLYDYIGFNKEELEVVKELCPWYS